MCKEKRNERKREKWTEINGKRYINAETQTEIKILI